MKHSSPKVFHPPPNNQLDNINQVKAFQELAKFLCQNTFNGDSCRKLWLQLIPSKSRSFNPLKLIKALMEFYSYSRANQLQKNFYHFFKEIYDAKKMKFVKMALDIGIEELNCVGISKCNKLILILFRAIY